MELTDHEIQLYLEEGWYPPIQTNISLDDRPEWGMWECIREIVQNSLDETGAYRSERRTDDEDRPVLVISDDGGGMYITNLLLGSGTKPQWARGRFGEGLKFGCLVALREGYDVDIYTVGTHIKPFVHLRAIPEPRMEITKEVQVLSFLYRKFEREVGTSVEIAGYDGDDYSEGFAVDRPAAFATEEPYAEAPPQVKIKRAIFDDPAEDPKRLFVRDIYVMDLEDALFSYNIWDVTLTRERNTPQSEYELWTEIGALWTHCNIPALIQKLLKNLIKLDDGIAEVDKVNPSHAINEKVKEMWREIWVSLYGEKTILRTSEATSKRAEWAGYGVIEIGSNWVWSLTMAGVVAADTDVVKDQVVRRIYDEAGLHPKAIEILDLMKAITLEILYHFYPTLRIPNIAIAQMEELDVNGAYVSSSRAEELIQIKQPIVALSIQIITDVSQTLQTYIHEMAHHTSENAPDLTKSHLHEVGKVGAYVASIMASNPVIREKFTALKER